MADFTNDDMSGSRFEAVDLSGARFHNVHLSGAKFTGVWGDELVIDGGFDRVTLNGVDVLPLVEAELDRRFPERTKLRPETADGFREAWPVVEQMWVQTIDRVRRLPEELLHERVDGEWSFIETLRHLVFVTDAWVSRAVLGERAPYSPLSLPTTDMEPAPEVPCDPDARPSLDEIVAERRDRMATVARVFANLTDEQLASDGPVLPPGGYPPAGSYSVRRSLRAVVNEEWAHRQFALRDLDLLDQSA
jgi:hypothetical protein